jgi:hypothetical protein
MDGDRLRLLYLLKIIMSTRCQWFIPLILATWEAEFRRITVSGQPGLGVCRPHLKK